MTNNLKMLFYGNIMIKLNEYNKRREKQCLKKEYQNQPEF